MVIIFKYFARVLPGVDHAPVRVLRRFESFTIHHRDRSYVMLSYEEISHLHENIKGMIQDFHLVTGKTYDFSKSMDFRPQDKFPVPVDGLNNMNVSWFLNHDGQNPNVGVDPDQPPGGLWSRFVTLRGIKEGEELRYDYNA